MLASDGDLYDARKGIPVMRNPKILPVLYLLQNRVPARLPFVPFNRNKLNIEGGREEEN